MRSLAVYLKNYKKESILAPFFKFLEVVFDLLVPIVIAQIIDVGIAHNDHGYIVQKFFILILMAAAGLVLGLPAGIFATILGLLLVLAYSVFLKICKKTQVIAVPLVPFLSAGCAAGYLIG